MSNYTNPLNCQPGYRCLSCPHPECIPPNSTTTKEERTMLDASGLTLENRYCGHIKHAKEAVRT